MKILVTGGAGFIASNVADAFIAAGHEVAIVDNLETGFRENVNPKAKFYENDIRDAAVAQQPRGGMIVPAADIARTNLCD